MVEQAKGVLASHSISVSKEASVILRWHAAPQSAGGGRGQSGGCGQAAAEPPRGRRFRGGSATTELTCCPPTLYRRASSAGFAWVGCRADGCWRWLSQGRRGCVRLVGHAACPQRPDAPRPSSSSPPRWRRPPGPERTVTCPLSRRSGNDARRVDHHMTDPLGLGGATHRGSTREKSMAFLNLGLRIVVHTDVTFGSTARCRRFSSFTRASLRSIDRRSALRAARSHLAPVQAIALRLGS